MLFAKWKLCWDVGPRLSEMSSNPVDIQKVVQNLGRKSTFSLRAPTSLSVCSYLQCPEWSRSSLPARCAPSCWGTSTCLGALRPGCSSPGSAEFSGHSAAFWTERSQRQGTSQRARLGKVCQHKRTWRPWGSDQRDGTAWWSERSATSADGDTSSPAWGEAGRLHRRGLLWGQRWMERRLQEWHITPTNRRKGHLVYQTRWCACCPTSWPSCCQPPGLLCTASARRCWCWPRRWSRLASGDAFLRNSL